MHTGTQAHRHTHTHKTPPYLGPIYTYTHVSTLGPRHACTHVENILSHWAGAWYPQNCPWIYKPNLAIGAFKASVPDHNQLPRERIFLSISVFLSRFWIPPLIFQDFQKSQGHITIPHSWRNPGLGMSKAFFRDNPTPPSVAPTTSNRSLSGLGVYTQMAFGKKRGSDPICLPILPGMCGQAFVTTDK